MDRRDDNDNNKKMKKIIHRDIERQRRQEMASLYASLRSLLPLEYIKGKRSISDHMNEAVKYIKHLENKIKELSAKRDTFKTKSEDNNLNDVGKESEGGYNPNSCPVSVRPCLSGIEVTVDGGCVNKQDRLLPLSRVLEALLEEEEDGVCVLNCFSTRVNGRMFHTVLAEVKDSTCVSKLEKKLSQLLPSSNDAGRECVETL